VADFELDGLLKRLSERDESALALLYARYSTPVYSLILQVVRQTTLAQEVTQDVFMKLWRQPQAYDAHKGAFLSWLLTLARYSAIDRLRQEVRRHGKDIELPDELISHEEDAPSDEDLSALERAQLRQFIKALPQEQAQLIELAYFQGLTHSQLAQKLGLPIGTVKTRLRLGLQKLRAWWQMQS
jgi:RNA polymerase sigma-70 factor (ECF subfamily)